MNTPEAWNGAEVQWTVHPNNLTSNMHHVAEVDGIQFKISYRPAAYGPPGVPQSVINAPNDTNPGAWGLQPLDGCTTTRVSGSRGPWMYTGAMPWWAPGGRNGRDWLDTDWGVGLFSPRNLDGEFQADDAYGNFSGTNGGNGGAADANDCPLIRTKAGQKAPEVKLHIQGSIYAPSATIALTGYSNDAPWVTDNITVRHLSAMKWRTTAQRDVPAVGNSSPVRLPRFVNLQICDPGTGCGTGHIRSRARRDRRRHRDDTVGRSCHEDLELDPGRRMRRPLRTRPPENEGGFTLVEVVASIVILGLVMAPLCMALFQAMNVVPASQSRTQAATDNDRIVTQFQSDISQTNNFNLVQAIPVKVMNDLPPGSLARDGGNGSVSCKTVLNNTATNGNNWWGQPVGQSLLDAYSQDLTVSPPPTNPATDVTWLLLGANTTNPNVAALDADSSAVQSGLVGHTLAIDIRDEILLHEP